MTRCYILALMSSILQHQLKDYLSIVDMILSLKEIFKEQGRSARQITIRSLMNTKMPEGTSVREHIFKMFDHLNTPEILGGESMMNLKFILSLSRCLTLLISLSSIIL